MIGKAIATALIGVFLGTGPAWAFGGGGGGIGIGAPVETLKPSPPRNVTATAGEGLAIVSFTPPRTDGGASITLYTVTAYPDHVTARGAKSPVIVRGLKRGETYIFTVSAQNDVGSGLPSAPSNAVTLR